MLLEHVKNITGVDEELENEIQELTESIQAIFTQLDEAMPQHPTDMGQRMPEPGQADAGVRDQGFNAEEDDVSAALDLIVKQMVAAKKGMSIVNKMPDSESRTKNRSRVMGNLNRIRGSLQRVMKMLDNDF